MRSPPPVHPGELLLDDFLLPRGLSQRAFAARLGWPPRRLNELVTGRRGITPESAAELGKALGTSFEFWLYAEVRWLLHAARGRRAARPAPLGRPSLTSVKASSATKRCD